MTNQRTEPVTTTSADINEERIAQLRQLFPEAFTEGKIDFDKLRQTLGDFVDDSPERYTFTWAGRRDAIRLLQTPTSATLVPAREESINFDDTSHIFIEGENLEVLKLLYKAYFGKVKMIYIDPPYNTGKDFVYPDNYADPLELYLQLTGQKDSSGNLLTSNPDSSGRFHSNWLNMMYPRLFIARQLLSEDGAIFVSIDDIEVGNLRLIMNEIFGEENFIANIVWERKFSPQNDDKYVTAAHDHILVFARNKQYWRLQLLPRSEEADSRFKNLDDDPRGPWSSGDLTSKTKAKGHSYKITSPSGKVFLPPPGRQWAPSYETFQQLLEDNRIWFGRDGNNVPRVKQFLSEVQSGLVPMSVWKYGDVGHNQEAKQEFNALVDGKIEFETPKPSRLIKQILQISTDGSEPELIVDFFAGSCTAAQAVLEKNAEDKGQRRFIMVQLPEPIQHEAYSSIADIGRMRIRRIIQQLKSGEKSKFDFDQDAHDLDLGFRTFKLAPSYFKSWSGSPGTDAATYHSQLALFRDPLIEGWQAERLVWEITLKEGYPLHSRLMQASVAGHTVYRVENPDTGQQFHITLEAQVTADLPRHLHLTPDDLFVCRDLALDDTTAANLALQCRLKTI